MLTTLQMAPVLLTDAVPVAVPEAEVALWDINIVDAGRNVKMESVEFVRVVIERVWIVEIVPLSMTSRRHAAPSVEPVSSGNHFHIFLSLTLLIVETHTPNR